MKYFHGESSLKTWIYRIALHEASNRRRWWFRHKSREVSMEPLEVNVATASTMALKDTLADGCESPFDRVAHAEVRARVEEELRKVSEPYRTTVILRDLEEVSYEEIAEITEVSLGTVKSRMTRGRAARKERLLGFVREVGPQLGLQSAGEDRSTARNESKIDAGSQGCSHGR